MLYFALAKGYLHSMGNRSKELQILKKEKKLEIIFIYQANKLLENFFQEVINSIMEKINLP